MTTQMSLILIILCQIALINHGFTKANPTYLDSKCSDTMFTPNSKYQTNLDSVFQSLALKATTTNSGSSTYNGVNGLFLCSGGVTTSACKDCVVTTTLKLADSYCPMKKTGVIWYTECMVRYSNDSFLGRMEYSPKVIIWNSRNLTGNDHAESNFTGILDNVMNDLIAHTSSDSYYAKVVKVKEFLSLGAFSQCTPDLTRNDCMRCLKIAMSKLPISIRARVMQPSCYIWYEVYNSNPKSMNIHRGRTVKLSTVVIIATLIPVASVSLAILALYLIFKRATKSKTAVVNVDDDGINIASLQYKFSTLQSATNNFSVDNLLVLGARSIYTRGILSDGTQIVVQRILIPSNFMNMVLRLAKLQHRNLRRLLGFCINEWEEILVLEYMPYDLYHVLFASERSRRLDWGCRFNIIKGIARGMRYLHQDSRHIIVHGDLKSQHILLDEHMNPKIADFTLAKNHQEEQTENFFNGRITGTMGYICPAFLLCGRSSPLSDVYSFGVLVLEIINGTSWSQFLANTSGEDLTTYAYEKWREGQVLQFMDEEIRESGSINEIERCLHLALLCVEPNPNHRPTMATTVLMLESGTVALPMPEQPAYMSHDNSNQGDTGAFLPMACSVDDASITEIEPR